MDQISFHITTTKTNRTHCHDTSVLEILKYRARQLGKDSAARGRGPTRKTSDNSQRKHRVGSDITKLMILPVIINPLNPELNPICYLLELLAHHFLHVSRIRVKSLTLRLLMSYIWSAYS